MKLVVRPERRGDLEAIDGVVTEAFAGPDEAALVKALRRDECWLPALSVVAEVQGDGVVAHVALTRLTVGGEPALALAPLSVRPDLQRRGVGSALVKVALARAAERGERLVLVVGDPAYYGRFGFTPAADQGITGPYADAGAAFQALALDGAGPPPRGPARYPACFEEV